MDKKNLLIPRNIKGRQEKYLQIMYKILKQEYVDNNLRILETPITNLGNVKYVRWSLNLDNNKTLKSLGNLEFVNGWVSICNTNIEDLGNLESCEILFLSRNTKTPPEQYENFNYRFL